MPLDRFSIDELAKELDGFDFDWEYPCGDYKPIYTQFIQSLRAAVKQVFGEEFLLTTAVGAGKDTLDDCYELDKLGQELDLIHLMTYDYHSRFALRARRPIERVFCSYLR